MITDSQKDPMGRAMLDYYNGNLEAEIKVLSNVAEDDVISAAYLFRGSESMPAWERRALDACEGKVLDIGAGAGSHALALEARGHEVVGLDISPGAVAVMNKRGVRKAVHGDIWTYREEKFDTLLLLMNGIGLVGDISGLRRFLRMAPDLLHEGGQVIMDSSDIAYLFPHNENAFQLLLHPEYYGIVNYQMKYKGAKSRSFDWLYIDFGQLRKIAEAEEYKIEKLIDGNHFQYLARLRPQPKPNTY